MPTLMGDEQTFDQLDDGLANNWRQDLRQQLQADIQEGFDKLSAKILHEIYSLLCSRDLCISPKFSPGSERDAKELPANSQADELVVNTAIDHDAQRTGEEQSPRALDRKRVVTFSPPTPAKLRFSESNLSRLQNHIYRDSIKQEQSLDTFLNDMVRVTLKKYKTDNESRHWLRRCVLSWQFTCLTFFMILANTLWMSYEGDQRVRMLMDPQSGDSQLSLIYARVSMLFAAFFMIELVLRVIVLRTLFFIGDDWKWNLYDVMLVVYSIPELLAESSDISFLRLVRFLKITKAMRLMRVVKFLVSLREIMFAFLQTLGCLFWSFVAILLVNYTFSLGFLHALSFLMESDQISTDFVSESFSSTGHSMLTLFTVISGGQDWYDIMQGFSGEHYVAFACRCTFAFYVFFMLFGLVNVVIGVFCARASEAASSDEHLLSLREEERYRAIIKRTIKVFHDMDLKGTGCISRGQFRDYVKTSKSMALRGMPGFQGLHFFDVRELWRIMVLHSDTVDGTVDLPGFVMGIWRFSGEAKSADTVIMSADIKDIQEKMEQVLNRSFSAASLQRSSEASSGINKDLDLRTRNRGFLPSKL